MKVLINGEIQVRHVIKERGKFFTLDRGSRIYLQQLRNGLLVPIDN